MTDITDALSRETRTPVPGTPPVRAQGIRWDLSYIHKDAAEATAALSREVADAKAFHARYEGKIASMSARQFADLLKAYGALDNRFSATSSYARMRVSTDATNPECKDLLSAAQRARVDYDNATRFLKLEFQALPEKQARALEAAPELRPNRHWLEILTAKAPHMLSAEVEAALADRSPTAEKAWQTLFGETLSSITADFDPGDGPRSCTIDELLAYSQTGTRPVREKALKTLYAALEPWTPVLAACYDSLVADRLTIDRLRGYVDGAGNPLPMQQANFENDLSDAVVNSLIGAVEKNYPVAQRYFTLKARLMGIPKLQLWDQYASLSPSKPTNFTQGQKTVLDAVGKFSPKARSIIAEFFASHRIDAEPRKGKRGGAFCSDIAQDKNPVVMLNFTDDRSSVKTLAHELGHGLHGVLAHRSQTPLACDSTGLAMAEVASTFNELLLFDYQLEREKDPASRMGLILDRIQDSFGTIFRQTMMAKYEVDAYAARQSGKSLTPERLSDFWIAENRKYYGDTMEFAEGYKFGWAYVPHFINTRFYTYSYSFAHLTSLALYAKYQQEGTPFVEKYLNLLSAGGSKSPEELLKAVGVDITDPHWVDPAFAIITSWIDLAEKNAVPAASPA